MSGERIADWQKVAERGFPLPRGEGSRVRRNSARKCFSLPLAPPIQRFNDSTIQRLSALSTIQRLSALWLVLFFALAASAQPVPKITSISPEWIQRGTTNDLTIVGDNLGSVF